MLLVLQLLLLLYSQHLLLHLMQHPVPLKEPIFRFELGELFRVPCSVFRV
jgi:hypothetical protein